MVAYTIRRLLTAIPLLLLGISLTFFIIHMAPGDPTDRFISPSMSPNIKESITKKFGLDQPLYWQYTSWLKNVVIDFDFGKSFANGRQVSEIISDAMPPTLLLSSLSLIFGLVLGTVAGVYSALKAGSRTDKIITSLLLFFYSVPAFWLGLILLGIFAIGLNWLPASQINSIFHDQLGFFGKIGDYFTHLLLPVFTLGITTAPVFGRFVRSNMIEVLNSDFIISARARGLSERKVIFVYGFRNALLPVISLIGNSIPALFSGAVVIEVIYSLPGMGRVMVNAALGRDYPMIMAAGTVAFVSVIIGNLLADLGYAAADPRVRLDGD
ncbi:MAG: ABC transporter permease [Candidatus Marinimicrobia bacterium]|nr:ABC transporter permease [Candidatus Neomarinimicrobiota bacterium]